MHKSASSDISGQIKSQEEMRFEDIRNKAGSATSFGLFGAQPISSTIVSTTPALGTSSTPLFGSTVSSGFLGGQPQAQNTFGSSNFPYANVVF